MELTSQGDQPPSLVYERWKGGTECRPLQDLGNGSASAYSYFAGCPEAMRSISEVETAVERTESGGTDRL